jgi:intracellular sulfur oxidation DsrE/DsrF family protein
MRAPVMSGVFEGVAEKCSKSPSEESAMPVSRKRFVATAALGLSGAVLSGGEPAAQAASGSPLHFHVLTRSEFDHAWMVRTLNTPKSSKQVFLSVTPVLVASVPSIYLHMQNSMNAYEFSYGMGRGSLATLAVFTGASVVYGLSDAMWKKYPIGAALNLASTNVYYAAQSLKETGSPDDRDSIYQDWSAQAVLHRGGALMVCHNALMAFAGLFAQKMGTNPADVLAEFTKNLLPGFHIVPAGVAAFQLAQEHGWKPYEIV